MGGYPLLGGLEPRDFLARHWQKRPLLIRGAMREWPVSITAEELAGLALDEDVESRVVMGDTATEDWMLLHGPFTAAFFSDTPERDWTLLVQDTEKHLPALGALLTPFRFVPDWRIDDLMISYAAPGGTVGPHVDSYDVFLLQGEGRRRWRIQWPAPATSTLRTHPDLRLVEGFSATEDWLLEPGDMLYLPPGVPHFGVAEDECLTYSIGFRAPSARELVTGWAREAASRIAEDIRYADSDLRHQDNPAEIPPAALVQLRAAIRNHLAADDLTLDRWLGRYLSEPKSMFADVAPAEPTDDAAFDGRLYGGEPLVRNPAVRMLVIRYDDAHLLVYAGGEEFRMPPRLAGLAERLAREQRLTAADLGGAGPERAAQRQWLLEWLNRGFLLFEGDLHLS